MLNLQKMRKSSNLSQQDVAHALGVTQSAVSHWEQGITRPTVDSLIAISKLFNCKLDELFEDE